jgi:hypothetical protein
MFLRNQSFQNIHHQQKNIDALELSNGWLEYECRMVLVDSYLSMSYRRRDFGGKLHDLDEDKLFKLSILSQESPPSFEV